MLVVLLKSDRNQPTEKVSLLSCTENIAQHKSLWEFHDMESEVKLILARATIFYTPQSVDVMTAKPMVSAGQEEPKDVGSLHRKMSECRRKIKG